MTRFLFDLYAMTYEFYRARDPDSPKPLSEGLCVVTCLFFFLNLLQLTEFVTNSKIPLPLDSRFKIAVFGLTAMGVLYLGVKYLIGKHPASQSPELMREYSLRLSRRRKTALIGFVVGNFILLILLAGNSHT